MVLAGRRGERSRWRFIHVRPRLATRAVGWNVLFCGSPGTSCTGSRCTSKFVNLAYDQLQANSQEVFEVVQ